jgi:hypothetical protein
VLALAELVGRAASSLRDVRAANASAIAVWRSALTRRTLRGSDRFSRRGGRFVPTARGPPSVVSAGRGRFDGSAGERAAAAPEGQLARAAHVFAWARTSALILRRASRSSSQSGTSATSRSRLSRSPTGTTRPPRPMRGLGSESS